MLLNQQHGLDGARIVALRNWIYRIYASREAAGIPFVRTLSEYFRNPVDSTERDFFYYSLKFFWESPLPDAYRAAFGREPLLLLDLCKFRTQAADSPQYYVPWHLDANFYGFEVPLLTAWVPLVDVGIDAPGLEFGVPARAVDDADVRRYWESVTRHPELGRTVETAALDDILGSGARRIEPALSVGSCFVFDQYVPHRTQILAGATRDRTALEFRIASAELSPGPGRYLGPTVAEQLGARYDRAADELSIVPLGRLFPELAATEAAG